MMLFGGCGKREGLWLWFHSSPCMAVGEPLGGQKTFLDYHHHLPKASTNLHSKLGCLCQTFFPQPVKSCLSLYHHTFILITDSG